MALARQVIEDTVCGRAWAQGGFRGLKGAQGSYRDDGIFRCRGILPWQREGDDKVDQLTI